MTSVVCLYSVPGSQKPSLIPLSNSSILDLTKKNNKNRNGVAYVDLRSAIDRGAWRGKSELCDYLKVTDGERDKQ